MRGLVAVLSAALSLLVLASADVGQSQTPFNLFGDFKGGGHGRSPVPYDLFVQHNSLQRSGTEIYLHDEMKKHFPGKAITVTADRQFAPLRFAAGANEHIQMRESKDVESLKQVFFQKPARRREGHGRVADVVTFGGYDIAWKEYDMKAIVATWRDGYTLVTQWHIISDDSKAAHRFIQECSEWCTTFRDAVLVFDNGYWSPDFSLYQEVQKADWKDVILDEEFKHKLQYDYRSFLKSEKIYKDLSVPWKRGLIFLGPPGNGKTISLKAIMKDVELPLLYVKSFRTYMGDEMGIRQIFQRARAEAPCVLIMEDLDSLINNQNRAFFLNELDGLEDNDGLLLIGTTNHFDRLDPALSNRPSRFDRKYNFPNPSRDERKQYALYWKAKLSDTKDIDWPAGLEDEVADRTDKFSFAYLKEAFVSALLTIAGREPGTEPPNFRDTLFDQIQALRDGLENAPEVLALPPAPQLGGGGFRADDCCGDFGGMDGEPFEGEAMMAQREGMRFGGDMFNLVDVL